MELTLGTGLSALPGIGDARARKLAKLGLSTVGELLSYYPRSYEDRTKVTWKNDGAIRQPD